MCVNLKNTFGSPLKLNGTITCILPESMYGKSDYPIWMMGLVIAVGLKQFRLLSKSRSFARQ